jgi:acetolactate synthase-1/2/3 large subunit
MTTTASTRRMPGGHAVVEHLRQEGVRHVFNVPGESFTSILDGLRDVEDIRLITNRQEGGACLMAEAYAKATRRPGVCVVTRGPGATNASIGIHCARYDSTPLVLLVGQVARAFHIARSGRPGPVVVSLPRDMLDETADVPLVEPYPVVRSNPDPEVIGEMVKRIGAAQNPILLAGSGTEYARAREELVRFSEKFHIPVVTTYRRLAPSPTIMPTIWATSAVRKTMPARRWPGRIWCWPWARGSTSRAPRATPCRVRGRR